MTVNQVPPDKSLGSMMVSGELDAVMFYLVDPNLIDRSTIDLHNHPDIKPLFADSAAEGVRYYRKTGLYPINHGMVIKRELAERHPWALTNILKAFKRPARSPTASGSSRREYYFETGILPSAAQKAFAAPLDHPWRCGQSQGARNHRAVFAGAGPDAEADAARGSVSAEHAQSVAAQTSFRKPRAARSSEDPEACSASSLDSGLAPLGAPE